MFPTTEICAFSGVTTIVPICPEKFSKKSINRDGKKNTLTNVEYVDFKGIKLSINELAEETPDPTPTPTPDPTPTPTPDPTPTPTPTPDPTPTPSWSFDNEPLSQALWGFDNFGQTIDSSDYGTNGADANIANVFDALSSPESGIIDLYSSQNTVAVLDTGVYAGHEDLFDNTFPSLGYDYVYDSTNHGFLNAKKLADEGLKDILVTSESLSGKFLTKYFKVRAVIPKNVILSNFTKYDIGM